MDTDIEAGYLRGLGTFTSDKTKHTKSRRIALLQSYVARGGNQCLPEKERFHYVRRAEKLLVEEAV